MTDSKKSHQVFEEIKAFSVEHFSHMIAHALTHAEKLCVQTKSNLDLETEEIECAGKTHEFLIKHAKQILPKFVKEYKETLAGDKNFAETQNNTLSLSLVDEDTLDEMIVIGELTGKVQEHYEQHLKAIKRGFVRVTKQMDFEPEPDAVTPKKLALILREQLNNGELEMDHKRLVYAAFADIADIELSNIYDGILATLQDHGIIAESENPASENFKIIYQYRESRAQRAKSALAASQPSAGGAADNSNSPLAAANLAPIAASAINEALFDDSDLSRSLYTFLSGKHGVASTTAVSSQATVESGELIKLLSSLQNLNTLELAESALTDSSAISQQVNQTVSDKIKEWSKNLSGPESNVIELVNNMFVSILEDPDLADPVKVQVGRLQIPYIKVALLDITLLKESAHPARLLLNDLAQLGIKIDDADSPLLAVVQDTTQAILDNFETDLSIFADTLQKLRQAVEQLEKNTEQLESNTRNKAETQAKLLHLKGIIVNKLRHFLKGKKLPKELHTLVLKGFAPLLLKIYSREGADSGEWQKATTTFRQLIESVQPRESVYQLGIIVDHSKALLQQTKEVLGAILQKSGDTDLLEGLESIYEQNAEKYQELQENSFPSLDEDDTNNPLEIEPDEATTPADQPEPTELPDIIKVGIWCELYLGRDHDPRRMKLASILNDSEQLVFIDPSGEQSEIKDMRGFLDELDCERSKIIQDNNLFDKALTTVIGNMQLMRSAS